MPARPTIAGLWYPDDPARLVSKVEAYLDAVPPIDLEPSSIRGFVVPHAGHRYSGPVAAYAYKAVAELQPERLIILGPLHAGHTQPVLSSSFDAFSTPLGEVPIDRQALGRVDRALKAALGRGLVEVDEASEHSIEVQLPFLQRILGAFQFVPILLANQTEPVARALAEALEAAFDGDLPLLLASSDLSHHYPQQQAHRLDAELLRRVVDLDPEAVLRAEHEGVGFACGVGAIAAALWAVSAGQAQVLRYATSGDVTGELEAVVGYASVCLLAAEPQASPG